MGLGQKDKTKANSVEMMAYRFCGSPTAEQEHQLNQFIGSCRFLWNRMLADKQAYYNATGGTLHCTPAQYKNLPGLEWLKDVDSLALANVQLRQEAAFSRFFQKKGGYPNFKKKHCCSDSYTTNLASRGANNIALNGNMLKLPKIKTPIKLRLHRQVKPGGVLKSVTVIREPNGKWYFALAFEYPKVEQVSQSKPISELKHIGLDMSLPRLYVDSNGEAADYSKPYRKLEKRIAKEQRKLSHMAKGSSNYMKQCKRIDRKSVV